MPSANFQTVHIAETYKVRTLCQSHSQHCTQLTHLLFIAMGRYDYYPYFSDVETEVEKLKQLAQVTELAKKCWSCELDGSRQFCPRDQALGHYIQLLLLMYYFMFIKSTYFIIVKPMK